MLDALVIAVLFLLSVWRGVATQQVDTLYDPVYRWRQSLVVALSQMREDPPRAYLGFKSIERVFTDNGFGVLADETGGTLPDIKRIQELQMDGPYLDGLLQKAMAVPIDRSLPPVLIRGNELGWADFMRGAFAIFGLRIASLYGFYFLLLGVSIVIFWLTFRNERMYLYPLAIYLVAHYVLVGYAHDIDQIHSVTNSRFFSAPAVLPGLYLLLVILRGLPLTARNLICASLQTLLLLFYAFCRVEAFWIVAFLMVTALAVAVRRDSWRNVVGLHALRSRRTYARQWILIALVVGSLGLVTFTKFGVAREYRADTKTHVFWHEIYISTISSLAPFHPEIIKPYLLGQDLFSDNIGFNGALAYVREKNDASSPIAYMNDGVLYIDVMRDLGAYDAIARTMCLEFLGRHPVLFLESFVARLWFQIDRMRDRDILAPASGALAPGTGPFHVGKYVLALVLSTLVALYFLAGSKAVRAGRGTYLTYGAVIGWCVFAALGPPALTPSVLLCGSILVIVGSMLAAVTALPALGLLRLSQRR